ncbi:MAG TPA: hypothetical protein VK179_16430 [Bacteroidales bacterium]|nr:hypothetical protein [Bacteroidales bacterium]
MAQINLSFEYYDTEQQCLFQGFPNAKTLNKFVQNGMSISSDEFLAYMMFTEQMDRNGFRTYNDLQERIQKRLGDIDDYLTFNNGSVQARIIGNDMMQVGFTERIGVALGLCVVNKIHDLTAADWKKISTSPGRKGHPTFDFEISIASTGTNYIQVENKGSTITDNSVRNNSVQAHYTRIENKKANVRKEEVNRQIPIHQKLFYGTIGVLDNRPNSIAKVWLVDPPAVDIEMNPEKYKLLARLHYYLDEFRNIGVREKITKALEKRIKLIEEAQNYLELDNKPLEGNFSKQGAFYLYMDGKMFAAVNTNEAFGRIFIAEIKQRKLAYLIAFSKTIMRYIVKQDFKSILSYSYNPHFINESVQVLMRLGEKENEETKLPVNLKFVFNERRKYFKATYFGKIRHSTDGRIFGLLNEEPIIVNEKSS